jgi:hypothetical protein
MKNVIIAAMFSVISFNTSASTLVASYESQLPEGMVLRATSIPCPIPELANKGMQYSIWVDVQTNKLSDVNRDSFMITDNGRSVISMGCYKFTSGNEIVSIMVKKTGGEPLINKFDLNSPEFRVVLKDVN